MKYFPKRNANIQDTDTCYRSPDPTGSDDSLQAIDARLARRVQEKVVVTPVAQAKCALRNPGQKREHNANLEAKNNVENDA